jgi:hypothetical protein
VADAPGRATVTVVFIVNDGGRTIKVEDSQDLNVQVSTGQQQPLLFVSCQRHIMHIQQGCQGGRRTYKCR